MANQDPNTVYAGPTGGAPAEPTFRALVWADFDATLRAALLANINCAQAGQTAQWLEFALSPDGASAATDGLYLETGVQFSDRPPAFEFVEGYVPRASCLQASSSGPVTIDIKFGSTGGVGGTSIFSTKLTIDVSEYTSLNAVQPVVVTNTKADDEEMTIIVDAAGTEVTGVKVRMFVRWTGD